MSNRGLIEFVAKEIAEAQRLWEDESEDAPWTDEHVRVLANAAVEAYMNYNTEN